MLNVAAVVETGSTLSCAVGVAVTWATTDEGVVEGTASKESDEVLEMTDAVLLAPAYPLGAAPEPPYDNPQPSSGLFPGRAVRLPVMISSMGDATVQLVDESRAVTPGHLSIPESPALQLSMMFCRVDTSQAAMKSPCPEHPERSPLARRNG